MKGKSQRGGFASLEAAGLLSVLLPIFICFLGLCEYLWILSSLNTLQQEELKRDERLGMYIVSGVQTILDRSSVACGEQVSEQSQAASKALQSIADRMQARINRLLACSSTQCLWTYDIHAFLLTLAVDTETGHLIGPRNPECYTRSASSNSISQLHFRFRSNAPNADPFGANYQKILNYVNREFHRDVRVDEFAIPSAMYKTNAEREFSNPIGESIRHHYLRASPLLLSRIELRPRSLRSPIGWFFSAVDMFGIGKDLGVGVLVESLPRSDFIRQ